VLRQNRENQKNQLNEMRLRYQFSMFGTTDRVH